MSEYEENEEKEPKKGKKHEKHEEQEKDDRKKIAHFNDIITKFNAEVGNWYSASKDSWDEYKRKTAGNIRAKQNRTRRYPLWYATAKTRQPLIFSKVPETVVQPKIVDTEDSIYSDAASVLNKFSAVLIDQSNFKRAIEASRDDLLLTCMGTARVYLDAEFVEEYVKIPLEEAEVEQQDEQGQIQMISVLLDPEGNQIDPNLAKVDNNGMFYLESEDKTEKVKKAKVCLKPINYKKFIWDYESIDFEEWEYVGFKEQISTAEAVERWGREVLSKLKTVDKDGKSKDDQRKSKHDIIEFWYKPDNSRYIFVENGCEFISVTEDPYGFQGLFPSPFPLFDNLPTDECIPVTEYEQVRDILDNINDLFSSLASAVRLARPRALFDSSLPELQRLIGKGKFGEYVGVPNLATKVQNGQALIQAVDVSQILATLAQISQSFDKEMLGYDQITGYGDVARGVTNPFETATATERKSQFTLHRLKPMQENVQRFCLESIKLMLDLALAKFDDEQIYEMVAPGLTPEEKANWSEILKLLKSDWKRSFTLSIETDSTIMINEDVQKGQALELAQALGGYIEQIARASSQSPEMIPIMVKILEHVVRRSRGGRAFIDDIQALVATLMQKAQQQQQQPPPPDVEQLKLQMAGQKLQADNQIQQGKLQLDKYKADANIQIENTKLSLQSQLARLQLQLQEQELSQGARKNLLDEFIKKANLELEQTMRSLEIQEKFMEEQRLNEKQNQPQVIEIKEAPANLIPMPTIDQSQMMFKA